MSINYVSIDKSVIQSILVPSLFSIDRKQGTQKRGLGITKPRTDMPVFFLLQSLYIFSVEKSID